MRSHMQSGRLTVEGWDVLGLPSQFGAPAQVFKVRRRSLLFIILKPVRKGGQSFLWPMTKLQSQWEGKSAYWIFCLWCLPKIYGETSYSTSLSHLLHKQWRIYSIKFCLIAVAFTHHSGSGARARIQYVYKSPWQLRFLEGEFLLFSCLW